MDSWINVRFAGQAPQPVVSDPAFHTGASGDAPRWDVVLAAAREVRAGAHRFLDGSGERDLERAVPYDGGIEYLRRPGLRLSYAMRTSAHHFAHSGEVQAIHSLMGHRIADSWEWGTRLI